MSQHEVEYMDIDEAEFIREVNVEIAHIRANATVDVQKYTDPLEVSGTGDDWPFCHVAVLDTNFLISHLAYLKNLLTKAEQHLGSLVLVVPWIVVMELDGLKNSTHQQKGTDVPKDSLGNLARMAMRFLESGLRNRHPALRGQKSTEIYDHKADLTKGDDRILDCCLYLQQKRRKQVTLLSNDRNLAIKAMIHDIASLSAESKSKMNDFLEYISKLSSKKIITTKKSTSLPISVSSVHQDDHLMDIDFQYHQHQQQQRHQQQQHQQHQHQHHQHDDVMDEDIDMMDSDADIVSHHHQPSLQQPNEDHGIWASLHAPSKDSDDHRQHHQRDRYSIWDDLDPLPEVPTAPKRTKPLPTSTSWSSKSAIVQKGQDRTIWSSIHAPP